VVEALKPQGLAGKVLVSGQDADLAALQRVAAGTQTMTVYKPISQIAPRAAELAIALAKKEAPQATRAINNGKADIPSILLDPITVDKANIDSTVIKDGYQKREDVYKNAPSH
jgi:D-xylose transport system substrate-binding protein